MVERLRFDGGNRFEKSLASAYELARVKNLAGLGEFYLQHDQKLMISGDWDYQDQSLVINQIKEILSALNPETLAKEEMVQREHMLWLWYHHAITCAVWKKHDKERAKEFATEALRHMSSENPNQITRLLYLLTHDRLIEAEQWADSIHDEAETMTATNLIASYKAGHFS